MALRRQKVFTQFPADFLWGAATAAHQVHGSPKSNWGIWEKSKPRLRQLIADGVDPKQLREFIAGDACRFEELFAQDFSMAKAFGHNSIRFSINWATVEPEDGKFDLAVLENYRRMCDTARKIGLEPIITFYHWTHRNGFEWYQTDAAEKFCRFVDIALPYLGQIKYFTVFNEPNVYLHFSYRWGQWPPCIHENDNPQAYHAALAQQIRAHRMSHDIIKAHLPNAQVGIGQAFAWHTSDDPALKAEKDMWQYEFLDAVKDRLDFIGIQLYMHSHFSHDESRNRFGWEGKDPCTDHPVQSDMVGAKHEHWGMCPEAIYHVVVEAYERYKMPIMVTEHGHAIPEMVDNRRCWYLWESIGWLERAIKEGIPLIGYLHWSLLDNFEWKYGWRSKFGLFYVDRATQKRHPRFSAVVYRDIIMSHGRTMELERRFATAIAHPSAFRAA